MWKLTRLIHGESRRRGSLENDFIPAVPPGYRRRHASKETTASMGSPKLVAGCDRQTRRREDGLVPAGVTERLVVATKPGNSGGAKGPSFKREREQE